MKISFRIWILIAALFLATISILNGNQALVILSGAIIIFIALSITYIKSKPLKILAIILLLVALFFSVYYSAQSGVLIKSVDQNSTALDAGLFPGMIMTSVNNQLIQNAQEYSNIINGFFPTQNNTKLIIGTTKGEFILFTNKAPEITVADVPRTKIKTGLDLSGGARALVKPERQLSASEMSELVSVTSNRLNVFGISDVTIRPVTDLQGNSFMLVEVAGATPTDIQDLVAKQGKFEAKIGNETVFVGGSKDITSVCRNDATCARIETCFSNSDGSETCRFSFVIYLSEEAATRHAEITKNIGVNVTQYGNYLDKKLDLYLDDKLVDSLLISEDLKGKVTTQIQIQGSGIGKTREDAIKSAQNSMKKLQTILITGSLPYKLEIVKIDSISPTLGKEFLKNIIILGFVVFFIVSLVLFIKYRRIKITLSVILTVLSEALLTLAIASLIRWNLDAPSIAGIIAGMGTGVNDQIVIIDESVSKESSSLKEKIKRAFFIIVGAFFTIIAAMLPLFWAGAGMLRGFALTTIIGVSVGILITRPAFADILKKLDNK
jgi:preprotein translocase subunit SecD